VVPETSGISAAQPSTSPVAALPAKAVDGARETAADILAHVHRVFPGLIRGEGVSLREEDRTEDGVFKTVIGINVSASKSEEVLCECTAEQRQSLEYNEEAHELRVLVDPYYAPAKVSYKLDETITAIEARARIVALDRDHSTEQLVRMASEGLCLGTMSREEFEELQTEGNRLKWSVRYHRGRAWVVEIPTRVHEKFIWELGVELQAPGIRGVLRPLGSANLWHGTSLQPGDQKTYMADGAFAEKWNGTSDDEPVLVLEVGMSQGWNGAMGLRAKKDIWFGKFKTVQCVLLVRANPRGKKFGFELWERAVAPATGSIRVDADLDFTAKATRPVTFNLQKYLTHQQLPVALQTVTIDLAQVRTEVLAVKPGVKIWAI